MRKIKLKFRQPRQLSNLLVVILLSFVIALPILSQPLGLASTWQIPAPAVTDNSYNPATETSPVVLDPSEINLGDAALNRSLSAYSAPASMQVVVADAELTVAPVLPEAGDGTAGDGTAGDGTAGDGTAGDGTAGDGTAGDGTALVTVDYGVYITAGVLNVRANPDPAAERLAKLEMGDRVQCIGETGDWLLVDIDGRTGYVLAEHTSRKMIFVPTSGTVYTTSTLRLRQSYGTSAAVITRLAADTKLKRLGIGDGWTKVRTTGGKIGYVSSEYLTTKKPKYTSSSSARKTSGNAPLNSSGNRIVDYAQQALGTPYVYGGESLSGMDCSGLVYWCYNKIGVSVPRSSGSYASAGVGVSLANARPGDVICLDTKNDGRTSISHLAIYVGGGRIIHASSGHDCVRYSTIDTMRDCGYQIVTVRRFPN